MLFTIGFSFLSMHWHEVPGRFPFLRERRSQLHKRERQNVTFVSQKQCRYTQGVWDVWCYLRASNVQTRRGVAAECRVELCTADGGTLKAFSLDECRGAPHEFRGVKRSTLLEALQSIVPESCIEYGAAIHSVETDQNGKQLLSH